MAIVGAREDRALGPAGRMIIGSLFSGIGGLELGLERAGVGRVAWQVEIDPFCRRVLARHWPNVERHEDVRAVGAGTLAPVDLICGGFPCQDVSSAGLGAGIVEGTRSGLWIEYLRIVKEMRPSWVVVENVASGKAKWLCRVRGDLQAIGYDSCALSISARDVGAPHRRERVFVLAHRYSDGREGLEARGPVAERAPGRDVDGRGASGMGDAVCQGFQRPDGRADEGRPELPELAPGGSGMAHAHGETGRGSAQSGLGGSAYGLSAGVDGHRWPAGRGRAQHAWEPPRTFNPPRGSSTAARLKALGNAVVPACAEVAGRTLLALRAILAG